jgi:hypothetical protein
MFVEAAIAFCVTNTSDQAVVGRVRDRGPAAAGLALDKVAAGQTGCVSFPAGLIMPMLHLSLDGASAETTCQTARMFRAGDRVSFTYGRAPSGFGHCYATEVTR